MTHAGSTATGGRTQSAAELPAANRLFIAFQNLPILCDHDRNRGIPIRSTADARLRDGTPVGGRRRQLRDTATKFA